MPIDWQNTEDLPSGLSLKASRHGTPFFQFSYYLDGKRDRRTLRGYDPRNPRERKAAIHLVEGFHAAKARPQFNVEAFFGKKKERPSPDARATVGELVARRIERMTGKRRPCTIKRFHSHARWLARGPGAIANVPIGELSAAHMRELLGACTLKRSTLRVTLQPLRAVIDEALEDGLLARNPLAAKSVREMILMQPNQRVRVVDPFTEDEIAAIYEGARMESANFAELVAVGFHSGLSQYELIALRWPAVDFVHNTVRISEGLVLGHVDAPKNEFRERDVELRPAGMAALMRAKADSYLREDGRIFLNPRHNRRRQRNTPYRNSLEVWYPWAATLKRAGVRYRPPGQMRHTYISQMLLAGEDPSFIQRQVGHSTLTMILTTYAQYIDEARGRKGAHRWRGEYGAAALPPQGAPVRPPAAPDQAGPWANLGHTEKQENAKPLMKLVKRDD
jgi:integrase